MRHYIYDTTKYKILSDIPASPIAQIAMREMKVLYFIHPKVCRQCGATEFSHFGTQDLKSQIECIDGQATDLIISKQRYKCNDCGKVTVSPNCADFSKRERAKEDARKWLRSKDSTMASAARNHHFSPATGSLALKEVAMEEYEGKPEDAWADRSKILSKKTKYKECSTLAFIPFEFNHIQRCLVCTNDNEEDILDILDTNSIDNIERCIVNKVVNPDKVETIYCDIDAEVVALMQKCFPNALIVFARRCIREYAITNYKKILEKEFKIGSPIYQPFFQLVRSASSDNCLDRFIQWWKGLPDELQSASLFLRDLFEGPFHEILVDSFDFTYSDSCFSCIFSSIKQLSRNRFEVMRGRILHANFSHENDELDIYCVNAMNDFMYQINIKEIQNFHVNGMLLKWELSKKDFHDFM